MAEKYKMFRNYMANELKITREDIMLWTKEAVAEETRKIVGQIDVHGIVNSCVQSIHYNDQMRRDIVSKISNHIIDKIQIKG